LTIDVSSVEYAAMVSLLILRCVESSVRRELGRVDDRRSSAFDGDVVEYMFFFV
jgi:hypothetical protein